MKIKIKGRPSYMQPTALCGIRRWWWKSIRFWPGETCQRCGRMYGADRSLNMNSVWIATDSAWSNIVGPHEGGRYCIPCFIRGCAVTGNIAYITINLNSFVGLENR